jgi:hypothetical protein
MLCRRTLSLALIVVVPGLAALPAAQEGQFVPTGSMSTASQSHTATLLPNGKVLIAGGVNGSGYLSRAELYDPAVGTFSATGSMSTAREFHTATLLPNGKVLMTGGFSSHEGRATAELYDPAAGTFSGTGSMSTERGWGHTATLLPNGKVLIAGGFGPGGVRASTELYDPATGTFSATGSMRTPHDSHTATLLPNSKVLIAGGVGCRRRPCPPSAELYDPATGTFSVTGSMTTGRYAHTATLLSNGKVLIAGGHSGGASLASAELYDPATGTFSVTGSMSTARGAPTATLLPNAKVLIAGGAAIVGGGGGGELASAELYDPATGTFTATGSMSTARDHHTATLLPNAKVLIAGGYSGRESLASAELYLRPHAVPSITGLVPPMLQAGSPPQTLTINGTGFVASSTAHFNGTNRATTFVNPTTLTIQLTSDDLTTAVLYPVTVTNPPPGGGTSNTVNFRVKMILICALVLWIDR